MRPIFTGVIFALALGAQSGRTAPTAVAPPQRKVIIIVADTATWEDYAAAPFMRTWLPQCALGLMNTRVEGTLTAAAAYLTLGAGSRVRAEENPDLAELALNYDEQYGRMSGGSVFNQRVGTDLRSWGRIGYLGLPLVLRENAQATYPLRIGLLGMALREAGLKTAAVGNADLPGRYRRQIVTIVMDDYGRVPVGDVGPGTRVAFSSRPPPVLTDYRGLGAAFDRALTQASVVAVETGDLARVAEQAPQWLPDTVLRHRKRAVAAMDRFVRRVVGRMKGQPWRLYLITPRGLAKPWKEADFRSSVVRQWGPAILGAGVADEEAQVLTPIVAWGEGISRGLLTSPATRRPGIVTSMDLAPTVLQFLGVPIPAEAVGRAMSVVPRQCSPLPEIVRMEQAQERIEASRPYVLKRVSALVVALFVITAALLILGGPVPRGVLSGLREASIWVTAFPLAALLLPGGAVAQPWLALVAVLAITAALYVLATPLRRWAPPWAWLSGAFTLILCADIAARQALIQGSLMSYSVTVGARFYGLGNELGGALLAAVPLALGGALGAREESRPGRLASLVVLSCVVLVIGHPAMGANFGVAIPAALGFGLMAFALYRARISGRHVLLAAGAALAAVLVILAANWFIEPQGRSHIGRAMEAIQHGGPAQAVMTFSRRAAFNWTLARHSIATWVLVSALAVIAGGALGRSRVLSEQAPAGSALAAGLMGAAVAAAVSFFVNDSGVLSAAWGLALVAAVITWVTCDWRLRQGGL